MLQSWWEKGSTILNITEFLEFVKNQPYHSDTQDSMHPFSFVIGWKEGKTYTLGAYQTQDEANSMALENFDVDKYIIVWSKYRDRGKLTQGIKHDKLGFENIQEATRRVKHV